MVADDKTGPTGGYSSETKRPTRIIHSVQCLLCRLNTAGLRTAGKHSLYHPLSRRCKLSVLIDYLINTIGKTAAPNPIHNHCSHSHLTLIALAAAGAAAPTFFTEHRTCINAFVAFRAMYPIISGAVIAISAVLANFGVINALIAV